MTIPECPTDERLRAFDCGDVPEDELDAIADHLGRCGACVARLGRLAVPLGELGPASIASSLAPDDSAYREAVERIADHTPATTHPTLDAGDTLRDYRIEAEIGRGGMGVVFRAVHAKLGKTVAFKVLSGRRWHDANAVGRFEREMRAVGRLSHPNIVQATDAGDADGVPFLVMELLAGENLSALVKRSGPRRLAEAIALIRQAAAGLHHAHRAGVVHRDVKPSNLMLATDGTVKVLDLGLALPLTELGAGDTQDGGSTESAASGDLTSASHTIGTLDYMAPEQKRNPHAVDERADVYGLGGTLWFLLTGRPPRADELAMEPLPGQLPANFWRRVLAADPAERFPTVVAVVEALDRAVAPRRWKWRALLAGTVALLCGGIVWVAMLASRRDPPEPAPPQPPVAVVPPKVAPPGGRLPQTPDEAVAIQKQWADFTGQPTHRESPDGPTFALIPPGELDLAVNSRFVITKPYWFGVTPVTRKQFTAFVAARGYATDVERRGSGEYVVYVVDGKNRSGGTRSLRNPAYNWRAPGYPDPTDDEPVTMVSWDDAHAYCEWLSRDGVRHRLPTEAEWNWAIRAGHPSEEVPDRVPPPPELFPHQIVAGRPMRPIPVDTAWKNPWGVRITGWVEEWCRDWFGLIPTGRHEDYENGTPHAARIRLTCGDSYVQTRSHYGWRAGFLPQGGRSMIGFRVVRELP